MNVSKKLSTTPASSTAITLQIGRYFNIRREAMQKVCLVVSGTLLASAFSIPALGVTLDGAADFQNDAGPTGSVGTASPTSGLNTNGTNAPSSSQITTTGFESFFTNDFGRLGTGTDSTQSSFDSGIFRRVSTPFQFSSAALLNSTQSVNFDYAFDGVGIAGVTSVDTLFAYLALSSSPSIPLGGVNFTTLLFTNPEGQQDAGFSINTSVLNSFSSYVIGFELIEGIVGGDSGVGFDNVRISNTTTATPVPFEFSPGMGILALGTWGALSQLKSKLKNRRPLNVDSLTTNDAQS